MRSTRQLACQFDILPNGHYWTNDTMRIASDTKQLFVAFSQGLSPKYDYTKIHRHIGNRRDSGNLTWPKLAGRSTLKKAVNLKVRTIDLWPKYNAGSEEPRSCPMTVANPEPTV